MWFSTPIVWGHGARGPSITTGDPPGTDEPAVVKLIDSKHAQLTDFPQGHTKSIEKKYECLDVSTQKLYSGPATWSVRDESHIVLTFPGSSISVADDGGKFGSQDWTGLRFYECQDFPVDGWGLGVECGKVFFDSAKARAIDVVPPCD